MMILLDGIARSGTSLLGRIASEMLEDENYLYYYEPFKHDSAVGLYEGWEAMMGRLLLPSESDVELEGYIEKMIRSTRKHVLCKEIRFMLKQDWLLNHYPKLKIIHITRDIMGVWSSHRRSSAPQWMEVHRRIWFSALEAWSKESLKLEEKGIRNGSLITSLSEMTDAQKYAAMWAINEEFCWDMKNKRLLCIEYEDLCRFPNETLDRLAEFFEVKLEDQKRRVAWKQIQAAVAPSDPSGPKPKIPAQSMPEVWRERLDARDIREIESVAGDLRKKLGYPPTSG